MKEDRSQKKDKNQQAGVNKKNIKRIIL